MKMDRKTKAARNPAKLKKENSKSNGNDIGKKPSRSVARTKTAKGQLPSLGEEARQMQEESIGSPQRLLATYEYAPIGITECSLEGEYLNVNEEFCRLTGYEKEELLTRTITDLTYEEDYIFEIKLYQRLVAGEIPFYKLEKRFVRKDGILIWTEVTRSLVRDADGKPLYTIGAVLDVSDRRQAEQALRESEKKYRTLFNSIDEGFCIIEKVEGRAGEPLDFRYIAANPAFAAQSGVDDVVGKTIRQAFPGEPEEWFETYDTILQTGEVIRFERDLVTQGRVLELYAFRVEDETHRCVAVIFKDITARKQSEEALRSSEALYRAIARSIPGGGVYVVDKDLRYLVAEGPVTEAFGLSRGMLEGHAVSEVFHGEIQTRMEERFQRAFAGETTSSETERNGHVYWSQYAPLVDSIGQAIVVTLDVTNQKHAEEALRQSKERYRNLFDLVPVAVYACDANGLIQEYNHRAVELWGREPEKNNPNEKFCGSLKIFYTDGRFMPHEKCPMARMLHGETLEPHELEILVERPDGLRRNVIAHPLPVKNERGEIVAAINCLYDITERKQAEEALQQLNLQLESRVQSRTEKLNNAIEALRAEISERKRAETQLVYQAQLIANVNDAIIATDENLAVTYWNQTAEQIYDWKAEEVMGRSASEVLQSEFMDDNTRSEALRKVNESGDLRTSVTHLTKDGTRIFVEAHTSTLRNEEGKTIGYISINRDVTERKQAEELLRRWAHIFEHADWGIATIRQDTFMMVNPTYAKMHGYTGEELVGRSIYDVFAPEAHADLREQIRIAYENGHHIYESKHIRRDGSIFPVLVDTTVVRDGAGNVLYRAVNVQDITERKRVEQELHESRKRLQILSQRLVEVQEEERRAIARELHDRVGQTLAALNINLIIMNGQLLEDSKQRIGSRLDDSMHLVAEAIALVRNVMTDLRPAVLDDYGLEAALQSYIDEYKSRYDVKVLLDASDQPIPRLGPSIEMTLLRIGQEALTNIARHAQAGQVSLSLRLVDHSIRLTVQDDGVGIESMQELKRPNSHGLKIMRERAEAFGGSINIESVPGKGTKVEATIPIGNGSQHKNRKESDDDQSPAG